MKNQTSRYLKYAIGEIILVVIGILIALQINNWNEARKQRAQETLLLEQLLSDFTSNLEQLDQKISMRNDFINSAQQLFKYIDKPSLAVKDSVDNHLSRTLPYATFDPIVTDLASTGELRLISDNNLKQAVSRWTSNIKDVIEDEQIWKEYRNIQYFPFLIEHYQLRTIRNKAYKANVLGTYSLEIEKTITNNMDNDIGHSNHKTDYHKLLANPDLEDHLTRCYAINSWANVQSQLLRKRIIEIIDLIKHELGNA